MDTSEEDISNMILHYAPVEAGWWIDQVIHDEIRNVVDAQARERLYKLLIEHSRIEYCVG